MSPLLHAARAGSRISAILLAIFFAAIGNNLLMITLPIQMQDWGANAVTIGWVMAGYSLGLLLGSNYGGKIITRVGHNRSYAAVAALIAIVATIHLLTEEVWLNFFLRVVVGVSMAVIYLTLESWLNATSALNSRATIYATYQLSFAAGMLTAPFTASLFEPMHIFSVVSLLMCFSLIPLTLSRYPSPDVTGEHKRLPIIEMLRDTPSGAIGALVSGMLIYPLLSLIPLYAMWLDVDSTKVAILLATGVGSSVIFQLPVGRMADRCDERKLLLGLLTLCLAGCLTITALNHFERNWLVITITLFFIGGATACIYPVSVKFIFNQINSSKAVPAMTTLLIFSGSGAIIGPLLASGTMQLTDPSGLFIYIGLVCAVTIPYIAYRIIRSAHFDEDSENIPYVISIHTLQPGSANLDPRTEYIARKITNSNIQALASAIAIAPTKTQKLIEGALPLLDGYQPQEILEALVLLKPRLAKPIIRAMLALHENSHVVFTNALADLISLDKPNINRLLFESLTHQSDSETTEEIGRLFDSYIQQARQSETAASDT